MTAPRTNWAGNVTYSAAEVLRPGSLDELRGVLGAHPRLRVVGTGHSFTDLADGEVAVSLAPGFVDVEVAEDRRSVLVGGGATYAEVATALRPHGLALRNLASLPHLGVAGAVATATHGSGLRNRNLADAVLALDLLTVDGDLLHLEHGDPDLPGAVVSLGLLGAVVSVRLAVEPEVELEQRVLDGLTWDDLDERGLRGVMGLAHSVSIFTLWGERPGELWVKSRADEEPRERPGHLVEADGERHPIPGLDPSATTAQQGVPGWWGDRLPHFRIGATPSVGAEIQSEYHVPLERGAEALRAVRALRDVLAPVLQVSEVRAVAADDLWLSPQRGTDTLSLHFTWWRDQAGVEAALVPVEEALLPLGARPHWGKLFLRPPADTPGRRDFLALRERLDPDRVLVNDWAQRFVLAGA